MNTYYLYLETLENEPPFNLIDCELIDVCEAKSLEDCLKESNWADYDAESNEQYCVREVCSDGYSTDYYPFGKAKISEEYRNLPKYSESIMRNVRQALGVDPYDNSLDKEIDEMDKMDVFEKWLQWEGLFEYGHKIKNVVDDIFYGR